MENVDRVVGDIAFGLSVYDLPDIDFRSLYEAGKRRKRQLKKRWPGQISPSTSSGQARSRNSAT